jgi:hypothetical protein
MALSGRGLAMISDVKDMILEFLEGDYDPLEFTFDLQDLISDDYDDMAEEDPDIAEQINNTFPAICAGYDPETNPEILADKIRRAYNDIFDDDIEEE